MKALNLYILTRIRESGEFSRLENILSGRNWHKEFSAHEVSSLCTLTDRLVPFLEDRDRPAGDPCHGWASYFDGFYFSYTIEHISKEFDLLKLSPDAGCVLNIELKSEAIEEDRVQRQLEQNRYYLSHISRTILSYTYVMETDTLYCLNDHGFLKKCQMSELACALKRPALQMYVEDNINQYFRAQDYLISPVGSPEKYLTGRYFLTNQQQQFGKELLLLADKTEAGCRFAGITGSPGTGKTLLLYDLARRLSEKRRVLVLHCARLSEGHEILRSAMKDFTIESIRTVTPEYLLQTKPEVILVDEAQRIYLETFELLVTFAGERGLFVVFCHDPAQILTVSERKRDISSRIAALAGENLFTLSSRLRTNMEIAAFVTTFFDLRKKTPKYSFSNIRILWAPDADEALRLRRYMESQGYIYIACSEGEGQSAHTLDTHDVIGLEFDRVVVTLGKEFYYDKTGCLRAHAHGNPNYLYDRMLFQNISRTRENLCIIIAENASLFRKAASLTAPGPDRSSGVPSL